MQVNSKERLNDIFFYGLYMDPDILAQRGVTPRHLRTGVVEGFELRIGNNATLLRSPDSNAIGVVCSLTHAEIDSLYRGAGLTQYAPESLLVKVAGEKIPALCCTLVTPPREYETNPDYEHKLAIAMKKNGLNQACL